MKKKIQITGIIFALLIGSTTITNAGASVGASIGIGHRIGIDNGVDVILGGGVGVGNQRGSGVNIGVSIGGTSGSVFEQGLQPRHVTRVSVNELTKVDGLENRYFRVSADGKIYKIFNGLGAEVGEISKDAKVFTLVGEKGKRQVYFVTRKEGQLLIHALNTKDIIKVEGKEVYPDVQYMAVDIGDNLYNIYNQQGNKVNPKPLKGYYSLGSPNYAALKNKGNYQLVSKQDFRVIGDRSYIFVEADTKGNPPIAYYNDEVFGKKITAVNGQEDIQEIKDNNGQKVPVVLANGVQVEKIKVPYSEGVAIVLGGDKKIYGIDEQGKILYILPKDEFDKYGYYDQGLAPVMKKVRRFNIFGVISTAIGFGTNSYSSVGDYDWMRGKERYSYINKAGEVVISGKEQWVSPSNYAGIMVYANGNFGMYSPQGKLLLPKIYKAIKIGSTKIKNQEYIVEKHDNNWGIVNDENKFVIEPKYKKIALVNPWSYVMEDEAGYYIYNSEIKESYGPYQMKPILNNEAQIAGVEVTKGKWQILNLDTGKELMELKGDKIKFNDNLIEVELQGKKGVYSIAGKELIPVNYNEVEFIK